MKNLKITLFVFFAFSFFFLVSLQVVSQGVEIQGDLKVSQMPKDNKQNEIVVRAPDGTLKTREARSLSLTDTVRTLITDIQLANYLCNCSYVPPFLVNSALASGYSIEDLVGGGVSILNLLDGGLSISDLLNGGQSVSDLITGGVNVQDLLDAGATPIEIYDAGLPTDSLYGKTYQGGLIAYLYPANGTGLIAAHSDQTSGIGAEWYNGSFTTTGATAIGIGGGQPNTTTIIAYQGPGSYAAMLCNNYSITVGSITYDDWFLPSWFELLELWNNLADSDGNNSNSGPSDPYNLGGFASDYYWSSTEGSNLYATGLDFSFVGNSNYFKDLHFRVRAVREF